MKIYHQIEHNIISAFSTSPFVFFQNIKYEVLSVGKPRPSDGKGECKTDIYVSLLNTSTKKELELKISVKAKKNHLWQESKLTEDRAREIFGKNFSTIISNATLKIKNEFEKSYLLYLDSHGTTQEKSLTMGWRLEITNTKRRLSSPLNLPKQEIINSFYKGSNLSLHKKNSIVNSVIVPNSGIANYILFIDLEDSLNIEHILNNLILLDDFTPEPLYFTFLANNYRFSRDKIDGNRPLAVYVDYLFENNIMNHSFVFNKPLTIKGKDLTIKIKESIEKPIEHYNHDEKIVFKKSL